MPDPNEVRPAEDEIRRRAYEIYETHGGQKGREIDDWLIAERELTEQSTPATQKSRSAKAG